MQAPIQPGAFVTTQLNDPKEQVWGRLLQISEAGISMRCIDTAAVESFKYQFKKDQPEVFPYTVFFPMKRVVKIYLDEEVGGVQSIIQSICDYASLKPDQIL